MLSTYGIINSAIILPALLAWLLLFSFSPNRNKTSFFNFLSGWLFALLSVSIPFLIWDQVATLRGHWSFNPIHISGWSIGLLPWEEVAFFLTVPFSMLTIFKALECLPSKLLNSKQAPKVSSPLVWFWRGVVALTALLAIAGASQAAEYTWFVFTLACVWLLFQLIYYPKVLLSAHHSIYLLIGFCLFLIFNGVLTSLPVVEYGQKAILNLRFATIPIEDFGYNLVLLNGYVAAYHFYETHIKKQNTTN